VAGLDDILGGGVPEFSFCVIGGTPGCGKTTLALTGASNHFRQCDAGRQALYFTIVGEPVIKMLR
jgi:circadian clock protein KaiC